MSTHVRCPPTGASVSRGLWWSFLFSLLCHIIFNIFKIAAKFCRPVEKVSKSSDRVASFESLLASYWLCNGKSLDVTLNSPRANRITRITVVRENFRAQRFGV